MLVSYAQLLYNEHMKRISLMITNNQYVRLMARAQELGIGFSELMRRILDEYLKS